MRQAASDGYYEEVRGGQRIPKGSLSYPRVLKGVGPWLCAELHRTPCMRTSQNPQKAKFVEFLFHELG
jgi:hypothetical protein